MLPFYGDVVQIEHPGTVEDTYGNVRPSFEPSALGYISATVQAHVQPGRTTTAGSIETRGAGDRNQVITDLRAWVDGGTHVCARCRVTWHDAIWDVDGEPQQWAAPFVPGHVEFRAVRGSG